MIQKSWPFARLLALSAFLALGYTPAQAQDQDQAPDPASQEAAEIEAAAELRDEIDIGNGWTRATPGGATNAAVYLEIENENEQEVRLIQVTSANAESVEIHSSTTQNGITRMVAVPNVTIAPDGEANFAPGGMHLMLVNLKAPLLEGDSFLLSFRFEGLAVKSSVVDVLAADALGPAPPVPE